MADQTISNEFATSPSPLVLEQQVCYALSIAARGVISAYKPLLGPLGLTHPQYLVMVSLWQYGPLHVKQLGDLLDLDSGTLSPLVKRLETMGLVSRQRVVTDERQVTVEVTEQGERLRHDAEKVHLDIVRLLGLTEEELMQLQSILTRVTASVTESATASRTAELS